MYVDCESIYTSNKTPGKKKKKKNTKHKFIRYLCFILVDFIRSCHHCLRNDQLSFEENKFGSLELTTLSFTILECREYEFFFLSKSDNSHLENSPSFKMSIQDLE